MSNRLFAVARVDHGLKDSTVIASISELQAMKEAFPDRKPGEVYAIWPLSTLHCYIIGEDRPFHIAPGEVNLGSGISYRGKT
jgi:hypothetical protein